jgi:hypothetical protein
MMSPQRRESGTLHAGLVKIPPEMMQQIHLSDEDDSSRPPTRSTKRATGSVKDDDEEDNNNNEDGRWRSNSWQWQLQEEAIAAKELATKSNGKHATGTMSTNSSTSESEAYLQSTTATRPNRESSSQSQNTIQLSSTPEIAASRPPAVVSSLESSKSSSSNKTAAHKQFAQPPPRLQQTQRAPPPSKQADVPTRKNDIRASSYSSSSTTTTSTKSSATPLPTPAVAETWPVSTTSKSAPPPVVKQQNATPVHQQQQQTSAAAAAVEMSPSSTQQLQIRCQQLEMQLAQAQLELSIRNSSQADDLDVLTEHVRQHESEYLQELEEKHQEEIEELSQQSQQRMEQIEREFAQERKTWEQERRQMTQRLHSQVDASRLEQEFTKQQKQLVETMSLLDEREQQVLQLRQSVKMLEGLVQESKATHLENEDIMEEAHQENDELRSHVEQAEARCQILKAKVEELQHEQDKMAHVQMELRLLKENYERERAKNQNAVVSATQDNHLLEEERDAALAMVEDCKQQLAAAMADLNIARADFERTFTANNNLQSALESFQSEREAELGMIDEQRRESEEAIAAAHTATLDALKATHADHIRQVQAASDAALQNSMSEIKQLEAQLKRYESDNIQMRRSLDEAIQRLQMNQEDVIDRTLMKNILMDWLTKTGVKERKDVLELMASVLHFTEEEKERVHITSNHLVGSMFGKLATPAPLLKADMDNLQGDTVSEKFLSFMLAETEE